MFLGMPILQWIALGVIVLLLVFLWETGRLKTFTNTLMSQFRNMSPLFWSGVFLLITVVIWTNGGSQSLTAGNMTWLSVLSLITAEVSIGFLVAWILIQFVEVPAREADKLAMDTRIDSLNQNMFRYVYGSNLPDELFNFIEEHILKTKFYRRNYYISYTFTEKIEGQYLIKVEIRQDIHNITDQEQTFDIVGTVEKPPHPSANNITSQPLGLTELFIKNNPLSDQQITAARGNEPDTEGMYKFKHSIVIPPNDSTNVKFTMWIRKKPRDYEIFRVLHCCESLQLSLRFPNCLTVSYDAIYPTREFNHVNDGDGQSLYLEIDTPLAPQNGVLLWWDEIESQTQSEGENLN